jgi:hypothetical protein
MNDLSKPSRFQRKLRSLWYELYDFIQGEEEERYESHEDVSFQTYKGNCGASALSIYIGILCIILFYILKYLFYFKFNELSIIGSGLTVVVPIFLFGWLPHKLARSHFKLSSFITYWSTFSILCVSVSLMSLTVLFIHLGFPGSNELKFASECALLGLLVSFVLGFESFKLLVVLFRVWLPSFAYLFFFTLLHYAFVLYLHPWFSFKMFLVFIGKIIGYLLAPFQ